MTGRRWDLVIPDGAAEAVSNLGGNTLEQYGAQLRDQLDHLGISTADTDQLYAVLAGQWAFLELLVLAKLGGAICPASWEAIKSVYRGEVAGLLDALPEEARR